MFLVENKVSTELSPVSRVNTTKLNQTVTEILFKENIKQKRKKKKRINNQPVSIYPKIPGIN